MSLVQIIPLPDEPGRFLIKVGRRIVARLPGTVVEALGVRTGDEWTDQLVHAVQIAVTIDRACRKMAKRINRRAMSEVQVRERLEDDELDEDVIVSVIEKLKRIGLIDDEALGRILIEQMQARGPVGPARVRAKLNRLRLPEPLVEGLIEEVQQDGDSRSEAIMLARNRLVRLENLPVGKQRQRIWGLLARRGYDQDTIEDMMESLDWPEEDHFD